MTASAIGLQSWRMFALTKLRTWLFSIIILYIITVNDMLEVPKNIP